MAHSKSAEKRIRQNLKQFSINKAKRTRVRKAIKAVRTAINNKDVETARSEYKKMVPIVDKMAARGIIHQNVAARTKSRLNKHIVSLTQQTE
ncbi:MAG: 30S ribosomal protein S20 [bacterium]